MEHFEKFRMFKEITDISGIFKKIKTIMKQNENDSKFKKS